MKKEYRTPTAEKLEFNYEEQIVACSGANQDNNNHHNPYPWWPWWPHHSGRN